MPIKCTALFQLTTNISGGSSGGPHIGGWSESWYSTDGLAPTVAAFNRVCRERAALLPSSGVIVGQRYQIVGGGSSSASVRYPGSSRRVCDIPQAALLCTARIGDEPNVRRFTLRGMPDVWVEEGELMPVAPFPNLWNAYKLAVEEGPFAFRARNLDGPSVRIASIVAGAVVLEAALVLAVGDYINIKDARDQFRNSVSGRYQVLTAPDNTHYTIRGWPAGSEVTLNGFASKHEIIYAGVNMELSYVRIVSRKVGRPFEQYRGRSSRRR